jgi:hypothetical protein
MHDRRAWPRYPLHPALACLLSGPGLGPPVPALALDVSSEGVRLHLRRAPTPGQVIYFEPQQVPNAQALLLRVVHVGPGPGRGYLLGGAFLFPLSAVDLQALRGSA